MAERRRYDRGWFLSGDLPAGLCNKELLERLNTDQEYRNKFISAAATFLKEVGVEDVTEGTLREAFSSTAPSSDPLEATVTGDSDFEGLIMTVAAESAGDAGPIA